MVRRLVAYGDSATELWRVDFDPDMVFPFPGSANDGYINVVFDDQSKTICGISYKDGDQDNDGDQDYEVDAFDASQIIKIGNDVSDVDLCPACTQVGNRKTKFFIMTETYFFPILQH